MVIVTVVRLISVPLFLYAWSAELYGEWLILHSLLTYFMLSRLGFTQAATNEMTMFVARNERDKALITYQTTAFALGCVGFLLMSIIAALVWSFPFDYLFGMELITGNSFRFLLLVFVAYVIVGFLLGLFMACYRCEGKYHRGINYYNAELLANFFGVAAMLLMGKGPIAAASVMLAIRTLSVLVIIIDLRFTVPWLSLGIRHKNWQEF